MDGFGLWRVDMFSQEVYFYLFDSTWLTTCIKYKSDTDQADPNCLGTHWSTGERIHTSPACTDVSWTVFSWSPSSSEVLTTVSWASVGLVASPFFEISRSATNQSLPPHLESWPSCHGEWWVSLSNDRILSCEPHSAPRSDGVYQRNFHHGFGFSHPEPQHCS